MQRGGTPAHQNSPPVPPLRLFRRHRRVQDPEHESLTGAQITAKVPGWNPENTLVLEGEGSDPDEVIVYRRGRVPGTEVEVTVAVDRGGRVDRRAPRDLDPVDARRRRPPGGVALSSPGPSRRSCPSHCPGQPGTTEPVWRLSPYSSPWRSPTCTAAVPPSLKATGEASATPHGASLRMVPAPAFHVSVSVSGFAADALGADTVPRTRHAPVTEMPARMQRAANRRPAPVTLPQISCRSAPKVVVRHPPRDRAPPERGGHRR